LEWDRSETIAYPRKWWLFGRCAFRRCKVLQPAADVECCRRH